MDAAGNSVVAWGGFAEDGPGIFGQRFDSSGSPLGGEFRINTTVRPQGRPAVTSDPTGNFVAVWPTLDGVVLGQRYSASGAALGREFRVSTSTGILGFTSISSDTAGNFVVVWESYARGAGAILGQRFSSGGAPLGREFRVDGSADGGGPQVSSDAAGNFVVVWYGPGAGDNSGIFGQRYSSSGTPLSGSFLINTDTSGSQVGTRVSSDATGNFTVLWNSDGPGGQGIFGQSYSSSGDRIGTQFRLDSRPQSQGAILGGLSSDAAGNFVGVWSLPDGPGDEGTGIFGRRFRSAGAPAGVP